MFFSDKIRQRCICRDMGGSSTNTIQESEVQKAQGDILRKLSPDLLTYMQGQLRGLNQVSPQLTAMLNQSFGGGITPGMQQALTGVQQQMRQSAAKAGVPPGDPRLGAAFGQMGEAGTKSNLPEIQTIMNMFGGNPQATLSQMGATGPKGSTAETDPGAGAYVAPALSAAATIIAAYIM